MVLKGQDEYLFGVRVSPVDPELVRLANWFRSTEGLTNIQTDSENVDGVDTPKNNGQKSYFFSKREQWVRDLQKDGKLVIGSHEHSGNNDGYRGGDLAHEITCSVRRFLRDHGTSDFYVGSSPNSKGKCRVYMDRRTHGIFSRLVEGYNSNHS